tara:strand:+ start:397 stop:624 length:228 start_codon:yes stop_codon:yes gene_type:complete
MAYTIDDINKILSYTSWKDKKKIDTLLQIDADLYTNLGKESSKTQIENVKKASKKIYRAIKTVDEYTGRLLLREQ